MSCNKLFGTILLLNNDEEIEMKTYVNRKLAEKRAAKLDGQTKVITFGSNSGKVLWVILVNGNIYKGE